jgi:hypothetical protein
MHDNTSFEISNTITAGLDVGANNHKMGKNGIFGLDDPLKLGWEKCFDVHTQIRTKTRRLTSQTRKFGPCFLVDVEFEGEKNVGNRRRIYHPNAQTTIPIG